MFYASNILIEFIEGCVSLLVPVGVSACYLDTIDCNTIIAFPIFACGIQTHLIFPIAWSFRLLRFNYFCMLSYHLILWCTSIPCMWGNNSNYMLQSACVHCPKLQLNSVTNILKIFITLNRKLYIKCSQCDFNHLKFHKNF